MSVYEPVAPNVHVSSTTLKLTEGEEKMYLEVLKHFSDTEVAYKIPGIEEKGELMEAEKFWLSYECILRYLRASKWKTTTAIERLEQTLKWRREFGLYDLIKAEFVENEAVTGKMFIFGYDTKGRPALYTMPSRQNTDDPTHQIQFTVWMLERSIDLMDPGVETLALCINYADKAKNPSFSTARTVLNILQDHYPERLGLALILNVPFLLNAFYKLITPFIDPVTREKMKFNPDVVKDNIITPDMAMTEWWGGNCNFVYEHAKYWPALVKMCEERHSSWMEKWRASGGEIGTKEWDYKGGIEATQKSEPAVEEAVAENEVIAIAS